MRIKVLRKRKSKVVPQSHLVAPTVDRLNQCVCMYVCVCARTCRTCCLLQVFLCSHNWLFFQGLYPLHNFCLRVCWRLPLKTDRLMSLAPCFGDVKHHGSVVIMMVLHQPENVSEEREPVPSHWHRQATFAVPSTWRGSEGFSWLCPGMSWVLAVLLHPGCSRFSSYIIIPQYGPACGLFA